jgi:hypothetical protein
MAKYVPSVVVELSRAHQPSQALGPSEARTDDYLARTNRRPIPANPGPFFLPPQRLSTCDGPLLTNHRANLSLSFARPPCNQ